VVLVLVTEGARAAIDGFGPGKALAAGAILAGGESRRNTPPAIRAGAAIQGLESHGRVCRADANQGRR
jgi:hypothetical protein